MTTALTWELDSVFPGGSESEAFKVEMSQLHQDMQSLMKRVEALPNQEGTDVWAALVADLQTVASRQRETGAFVSCLSAQNTKDDAAKMLSGQVTQNGALLTKVFTLFDAKLDALSPEDFTAFVHHPSVAAVRFSMEERKQRVADRLPAEQEALVADLSVDGYHAWGKLYDVIVGRMSMTIEENGRTETLSMGQAHNKLSDPNRELRKQVFAKWEQTWSDSAELCANTLNHLGGYRLALYSHRGWDSVLKEPLQVNRMQPETLHTMWDVISKNKAPFVTYLHRKAELMGLEKLSWHDVSAPLGSTSSQVSFDEARSFVVENFGKFSKDMANFANSAFDKRWIEAEDRGNKGSGAFCTSFPKSRQTRVFMTFSGSASNVSTLAHELGHAYHQHVLRDRPQFAQNYAMNVAETASTFAEAITIDAAIKQASSVHEKAVLLDDKVERSATMFMNIHARFLFESHFYQERKSGLVRVQRLNELMEQAQREAFCDALGEYHPHFWASKLHFYITGTPFYNFPYTFGYLFSTGIYAHALEEGASFADKYVALLQDTASMTTEALAKKHLGVDLTKPDFWQDAVNVLVKDVDQYLDITKHLKL